MKFYIIKYETKIEKPVTDILDISEEEDLESDVNNGFNMNETSRRNENNPVDEMLFEDDEEDETKISQDHCEGEIISNSESMDVEVEDKYANYKLLTYQGEEYYVKKKNEWFPINVMNKELVIVGIINADDINNIKMM
jgi:hypothetical protein